MKKTVAIIATAVVVAGGILATLSASQEITLNRPRFDGFDKKRLKKAYKTILRDALAGKMPADDMTEEELDAELIARYHAMG